MPGADQPGVDRASLGCQRVSRRSSWNRSPQAERTRTRVVRVGVLGEPAPTQSALPQIGCRWIERARRPLDLLAVIFLIDLILI